MSTHYEIVIIGGGPAGLAAGARAAERKISHLVIEKAEIGNTVFEYQLRKHVMDEPRHLPLRCPIPFKASSREQVLEGWNNTIKQLGVRVRKAEVTSLVKKEDAFEIVSGGETITASKVILAIGSFGSPRKLGVPGEDSPHVAYTLADPDAFKNRDIIVVGAGDAAIENALALAAQNRVSLLNRSAEFPRAKDANVALINNAVKAGRVRVFFSSTIHRVEPEVVHLSTPDGDITVKATHIIARLGSVPPRAFLEKCGVVFPSKDALAVPVVSDAYESNVPGLYLIGSLVGYPLIKQALNQGFEVVEHIAGSPVDPADQPLIEDRLKQLSGTVQEKLAFLRERMPLFSALSSPQFRELVLESTIQMVKPNQTIFEQNDYGDSFFSILDGAVSVAISKDRSIPIPHGNFFGELGLLSGRRRTATINGAPESPQTMLFETPRKQILKLINSVGDVRQRIDRTFALRILQTQIFPEASTSFIEELASRVKSKTFKKNDIVCKEGEPGDVLYVIRKGSVKISRRNIRGTDVAQTYVAAGNYVGEMALLSDREQPRSATVTAAVPCEVLILDKKDFLDLLHQSPATKERITRVAEERRLQNMAVMQDTFTGKVLDFLLSQGVSDADNVLVIDSDLCIGCDNCERACAATHGGYSRLDRKGGKSFASIQVPISCRHCENPLCMLDCPPDALVRRPDGEVVIKESCIGCGNCVSNCPYGVIQMVHDHKRSMFSLLALFHLKSRDEGPAKAAKCDLCETMSGGPACVRSCPTGAALRMNPKRLADLIGDGKREQ